MIEKLKFPSRVALTSAGTRQSLSPGLDLLVYNFAILWGSANTGTIYVGESDVTSTKCFPLNSTAPCFTASADERLGSPIKKVYNLRDVYIDGSNTGDVVYMMYTTIDENRVQ